jgi:hypothetical protein
MRDNPTDAEHELWRNPLYTALKAASVSIRFVHEPEQGWLFIYPAGTYGPFGTPEVALEEGVRALLQQIKQADA